MNFQCMNDVKGDLVICIGIYLTQTPAPSLNSSREKFELVDLPKLGCKRRVFSASRQLMSVFEVREVIVNDIKKICPVIFELSIKYSSPLSITASCLSLAARRMAKTSSA